MFMAYALETFPLFILLFASNNYFNTDIHSDFSVDILLHFCLLFCFDNTLTNKSYSWVHP